MRVRPSWSKPPSPRGPTTVRATMAAPGAAATSWVHASPAPPSTTENAVPTDGTPPSPPPPDVPPPPPDAPLPPAPPPPLPPVPVGPEGPVVGCGAPGPQAATAAAVATAARASGKPRRSGTLESVAARPAWEPPGVRADGDA